MSNTIYRTPFHSGILLDHPRMPRRRLLGCIEEADASESLEPVHELVPSFRVIIVAGAVHEEAPFRFIDVQKMLLNAGCAGACEG